MNERFIITLEFTDLREAKLSFKDKSLLITHEPCVTSLENPDKISENNLFYQFAAAIYEKIGVLSEYLERHADDLDQELDENLLDNLYNDLN